MPISPELWEQTRILAEKAFKEAGGPGVRLREGPCDGWYGNDDATMLLLRDWFAGTPEAEKQRSNPGHYELVDEMDRHAGVARWMERRS